MNTVRRESSEIEVCAYSAGGPGLHSRRNQDPPGPLVYISVHHVMLVLSLLDGP
jgi:hypothetical protein